MWNMPGDARLIPMLVEIIQTQSGKFSLSDSPSIAYTAKASSPFHHFSSFFVFFYILFLFILRFYFTDISQNRVSDYSLFDWEKENVERERKMVIHKTNTQFSNYVSALFFFRSFLSFSLSVDLYIRFIFQFIRPTTSLPAVAEEDERLLFTHWTNNKTKFTIFILFKSKSLLTVMLILIRWPCSLF